MPTQNSIVKFLVEQMHGAGVLVAKPMFGEYGIWCDGKIVALVGDDTLFLKPTAAGRKMTEGFDEEPAYPGAKASIVIPSDRWEDGEWMANLIRTTAADLPAPKPKAPKKQKD